MKAVIIEDEKIAAESLKQLLAQVDSNIEIITTLQSVDESVNWLSNNEQPDIIFVDIHLADGSSFMIFEKIEVTSSVIFTTAYDEYALKAFKVNSIDYLLKPISKTELERAINKYKNLKKTDIDISKIITQLAGNIETSSKKYKSHFLIPERDKLIPLAVKNIAFIYIDNKIVKAYTHDEKIIYLKQTMDELMEQLDPQHFFRANRQFIVAHDAIKDISMWFGNKIVLNMKISSPEKIIVSKTNVSEFKTWFSE